MLITKYRELKFQPALKKIDYFLSDIFYVWPE